MTKRFLTSLIVFVIISIPGWGQSNTFPSDGNVGIGTTNPRTALDVVNANFTGITLERAGTGGGTVMNFINGAGTGNWSSGVGANDHFGIYKEGYSLGSQFIITDNENVVIGVRTPSQKLSVAGTGKFRELIVDESTGADFVFQKDYDLPNLSEVEQFIKANKHLSEIPSAGQMKQEGVKVGALQIKLLQKIEELTLYTIEQQKMLEEQQSIIRKLQSQISGD